MASSATIVASNPRATPVKQARHSASSLSESDKSSKIFINKAISSQTEEVSSGHKSIIDCAPPPHLGFRQTCLLRESHGRSIFGLAFNNCNRSRASDPLLFATTASYFVAIYQCNPITPVDIVSDASNSSGSQTGPASIMLLQSFADPAGEEEEFYCCAWTREASRISPTPQTNILNGHPTPQANGWWTGASVFRHQDDDRSIGSSANNLKVSSSNSFCELAAACSASDHGASSTVLPLPGEAHLRLPPGQQLLAVAGKRGVIRLLCPGLASCPVSLTGHGQAINELRFHPVDPALLFSFSKDYNICLWNVATRILVAIFGGAEGHRSEVLHGDINLTGELMLSAGMDHTVKIWRLNTPEMAEAIELSYVYRARSNSRPFPTLLIHFPEFSSRSAHGNYVDCARWFGGLVVSKSCENCVVLWRPGQLEDAPLSPLLSNTQMQVTGGLNFPSHLQPVLNGPGKMSFHAVPGVPTEHRINIIHQLKAPDCNLWYIRFDLDLEHQLLALGTGTGASRIYLWDLSRSEMAFSLSPQILPISFTGCGTGLGLAAGTCAAIRQTRFADDGRILLCVGDSGLIVRFDRFSV